MTTATAKSTRAFERCVDTFQKRDDWTIVVASCTMRMVCLRAAPADGLQ